MGKTRRSGNTADEALRMQFHIAGSQKGVGSFSRRHAFRGLRRPPPQAVHSNSYVVGRGMPRARGVDRA